MSGNSLEPVEAVDMHKATLALVEQQRISNLIALGIEVGGARAIREAR